VWVGKWATVLWRAVVALLLMDVGMVRVRAWGRMMGGHPETQCECAGPGGRGRGGSECDEWQQLWCHCWCCLEYVELLTDNVCVWLYILSVASMSHWAGDTCLDAVRAAVQLG
jgi:hypothetical protein